MKRFIIKFSQPSHRHITVEVAPRRFKEVTLPSELAVIVHAESEDVARHTVQAVQWRDVTNLPAYYDEMQVVN